MKHQWSLYAVYLLLVCALPTQSKAQSVPSSSSAQTTYAHHDTVRTSITLTQHFARLIVERAEAEARRMNLRVAIALVNAEGLLLHFTKMDESTPSAGDLAIKKALHAVHYRRNTKVHADALKQGNTLVLTLPNSLPIDGGVMLMYRGIVVGAIGISGASAEEDGIIATISAALLSSK
jgi:glc operon protein GlcG